jgi:hypothetical protein
VPVAGAVVVAVVVGVTATRTVHGVVTAIATQEAPRPRSTVLDASVQASVPTVIASDPSQLTFFALAAPIGESFVVHDPFAPDASTAVVLTGHRGPCRPLLEMGEASVLGPLEPVLDNLSLRSRGCGFSRSHEPDYVVAYVRAGAWSYRLTCGPSGDVHTGRVTQRHGDDRATINLDDDVYRIEHGTEIPDVTVGLWAYDWVRVGTCVSPAQNRGSEDCERVRIGRALVAPKDWRIQLHLTSPSGEHVLETNAPKIVVPGRLLRDGTYRLRAVTGVRKRGVWVPIATSAHERATLVIATDPAALPFQLASPADGARWGTTLSIQGTTRPGAEVHVLSFGELLGGDGALRDVAIARAPLHVDPSGRFAADVPTPSTGVLVIEVRHPSHGTHYFLRRAWHAGGRAQPGELD